MYSIQQQELFSFQQLLEIKPDDRYAPILEHLDFSSVLQRLGKQSRLGPPQTLNFPAMLYSLLIAKIERMDFVKDIVRRLKRSVEFRMQCRFTGSDATPSEASYSRLIRALNEHQLLEMVQDGLVLDAISEGFLPGIHLAFDSSAVEAWNAVFPDAAAKRRASRQKKKALPPQLEQLSVPIEEDVKEEPAPPPKPQKYGRGRPKKEEAIRRAEERKAYEATLTTFEKPVADMLPYTYEELMEELPRAPERCSKKNAKGFLTSWYGYKANVIVDADSQYVLTGFLSSANINDQRGGVVLLKAIEKKFPMLRIKHIMSDKGYDAHPLYKLIYSLGAFPIIDFIHHTEPPEGFNKDFHPICEKGKAYVYDSYDSTYKTLKFTRPKECSNCPLADNGCQKVYKIKVDQDIRKNTVPARGSEGFKHLYKKRTAVERVFAYLKEYFGLHRTRHRGTRAEVDFQLSTLAYTVCKFALDKWNQQLEQVVAAA